MNADPRAAYIANCNICLLAPAMRDCRNCLFRVGLEVLSQMFQPKPEVSFDEVHDAVEDMNMELERQRNWLGYELTSGDMNHAAYGELDLSKPNTEFGSAAWFAGIDPIEF